jgi:hypothetical protein
MKKTLLLLLFTGSLKAVTAQKVESIHFNLYTDSLKKGQYNYINVDGKLSNGRWWPLTSKEVTFFCTAAEFSGNELIIPDDFKEEKVTVKVVLKANPSVVIEKTIWIKKIPDPLLPTRNEIMNTPQPTSTKKSKKKSG